MKRNDWSTERMMDVNESWRTVTHFFAGYLANERIKDCYQMPSVVPQQCRHGLSSWKRWFLLERWESIFIMEVNIERKLPRLHEKEFQALFFLVYQYNNRWTCVWNLSSPLADWTYIYYFHYESYIESRDPDDTESGRTVHTFSLVIRMSSCLVGAFEFFFWRLFGYRIRDEEMRWWCHQS